VREADEADFVLFVHAGTGKTTLRELLASAAGLQSMAAQRPVALVDLAASFQGRDALLPTLLTQDFPLPSLIAYAGWNAAGNAIGTAMAQSTLFLTGLKTTKREFYPYLYQKNFEFTIARLLDDWAYQKEAQALTAEYLKNISADKDRLAEKRSLALAKIGWLLYRKKESIFYGNLARYPFYRDSATGRAFYATSLATEITLPWDRLFEIEMNVAIEVGEEQK
jgi:hypothetical protein